MKFKRTSYLTRLAALSVAAATLLVPLAEAPAAFAEETSGKNSLQRLPKRAKVRIFPQNSCVTLIQRSLKR